MRRLIPAALFLAAACAPACAHSSTRGFVLLLPTGYVILGGALAVLAAFAVISLSDRSIGFSVSRPGAPKMKSNVVPSVISAGVLVLLLWIGFSGPRDPAENLLPLTIWTLWWVVIVLLHPVFGNLWSFTNPFSGVGLLIGRFVPAPLPFPERLAYWPALLVFGGFAWFQLVYPRPEDPPTLAFVVLLYALGTLLVVAAFGPSSWLTKADPFAIFLSQLGAMAPFGPDGLRIPGAGLLSLASLPVAGTLFVLLTLSSISLDGLANTFFWLAIIGVNPLDFPGRTAIMEANTLGLLGSFACLSIAFAAAVWAGWNWSGRPAPLSVLLGRLVLSLVPISVAYHLAHYLGDTLLNLQYAALALNDPFETGANLLGLEGSHVTASFQNTAGGALILFSIQTVAITLAHVVAVAVAHGMALGYCKSRRAALKLEAPLAVLMVVYTAFGLWLLATPSIS